MYGNISGRTSEQIQAAQSTPESIKLNPLFFGRESEKVTVPVLYHDPGAICFNKSLTPLKSRLISQKEKPLSAQYRVRVLF